MNYTEKQIQAMIEKIRKIKPQEATRKRAVKILNMLPEVAGDIARALRDLTKEFRTRMNLCRLQMGITLLYWYDSTQNQNGVNHVKNKLSEDIRKF